MKKAVVAIVIILVLASIVVLAYVRKGQSADMGASRRGMESFPVEIASVENGDIAKKNSG